MKIIPVNLGIITAFIVKHNKSVIIDTGYAGSDEAVLDAIDSNNITKGDVSLIIITHGHFDHFEGAAALRAKTGAPVAAHRDDAGYVRKGINPPIKIHVPVTDDLKTMINEKAGRKSVSCEVDLLLEDGMSLERYGIDAKVVSTPGHTPGSVSVLVSGGDCIVGDLIMGRVMAPRVACWPLFTDDLELVKTSTRRLLDMGALRFWASHGGPFSRKQVERLIHEKKRS